MLGWGDLTGRLDTVFYSPEIIRFMERLSRGNYPLIPISHLAERVVDGPFGTQLKVDDYQANGIPVLRVSDIRTGQVRSDKLVYISPEKHQQLTRSRVIPNDVLLTKAGAILGYSAVFPPHLREANITSHLVTITCSSEVNPHYLRIIFRLPIGQRQIYRWGNKSTRPELNTSEVKQILIPVPSHNVQNQIIQIMVNAHQLRHEREAESAELLASIDTYLLNELGITLPPEPDNTIQNRMFYVGWHNVSGDRLDALYAHASSKPQIEFAYPSKRIRDLVTSFSGGTPSKKNPAFWNGTIPWASPKDISGLILNDSQDHISVDGLAESRLAPANAVLLVVRSGILKHTLPCVVTGRQMAFNQDIKALIPDDEVLPAFLAIYLQSLQHILLPLIVKHSTTVQSINSAEFENIRIPIPPITKQREIVAEITRRRERAQQLRRDAAAQLAAAKQRIEQLILGG